MMEHKDNKNPPSPPFGKGENPPSIPPLIKGGMGGFSSEKGSGSVQILIVDDDKPFGQMLENVIRKLTGFVCSFVESAREALEVLEERVVDVVITDIKMPDMSGIELTRIIKEKYASDVIVITGYYEDFTYEEAIENGANDFIEKPVRPTELILRLKRVLRERAILYKREQAKDALIKSEKSYHAIFDRAMEGLFQTTPEGQFVTANKALARMLGYESPDELMATVTYIPAQLYARQEDYAALLKILNESGSVNRYEAQFRRKDGRHIWISTNMMSVRNNNGQLLYYEGNVEDISPLKSAEGERENSIKRLREALGAMIRALATTAETRDPYTAGHQRRVADLARAIATEMGLTADNRDGIRMAAVIHDIGKISVPAEILSMPRKLTEIEFSLIKTHAQHGYDILRDIEFPWPIARMVLEHHERMDGSGYPNGLTGDKLLIESRIIAVADVIEAIASHRPYRPGLGIDVALGEISKNKGILYDVDVADTCLKLFHEHKYKLELE
jgi:PAS domain S-box-containing protein/putative nucleotidyltransferase with HDIG domain